jgi:hypothetical protein
LFGAAERFIEKRRAARGRAFRRALIPWANCSAPAKGLFEEGALRS